MGQAKRIWQKGVDVVKLGEILECIGKAMGDNKKLQFRLKSRSFAYSRKSGSQLLGTKKRLENRGQGPCGLTFLGDAFGRTNTCATNALEANFPQQILLRRKPKDHKSEFS